MEIKCSKCGRVFFSGKENEAVCPDCLRGEFTVKAPSLNEEERAELVSQYQSSIRRQSARAEMMGNMYASGKAFSVAGRLRFALGLAVFLICCFLFVISDKQSGVTFLTDLDKESQRIFAMILCIVAGVLMATSSIRFRMVVRIVALLMVATGWFLPDMLAAVMRERSRLEAEAAAKQQALTDENKQEEKLNTGKVLTDEDLQVYYTLGGVSNKISHYAIFLDKQDSRARSLVRDALNRLLGAEYTRAYTRANGALYVATNVPGARKNISGLLARFGTVTYAEPMKGVYEVRFDADRANLVSQYSSDVLTSPSNNAYVTANLSELRCLDPMRVRMSARSLASSNVPVLRREIRDTLIEVLQEPWDTEVDTYSALIDAMVTYAMERDEAAVKLCYEYFQARQLMKRDIAPDVTLYLIREVPQAMVKPIVDYWCDNPIAWNEMLVKLGPQVQPALLSKLANADNIRLITSILKYLEDRGTPDALAAVEKFFEYPDSIIRHSARAAHKSIQVRAQNFN